MILYFADRLMNIIGTASTNLPKSIVITNDAKTEDVDSGASAFECELSFDEHNRAKLEEITEVGNYLLRSDKGENEFYTIIDCEIDTKRQTAYIYAEDAGLDLLNDIIEPFEAGDSYEISYYVERTAKDAGWEIGVNELEGVSRKLKFADEQTGTARLLSIAKEFNDCEISFSFEVKGLQVTRKLINIYEQRGKDTDIQLRLNKQIDSIVTKKTINNLATALKAKGSSPADGENPITLLNYSYDDGDFYVDGDVLKSREALKQWERYLWKGNDDEQTAGHIVKTFSYDTTSQAVLCEKAIEELKKIRDMEVNYEIEIVELPESARVGDRVNVIDEAGKLYLSTRLLKLVTSVTKQSYKATLGENFLKGSGIEAKVTDLAQQFASIAKSRVFYTWIAYADDENGTNISTEPEGKAYIGIATNKTTEAVDISDPSVFTWSKIKGEDGKDGQDGQDGINGTDGTNGSDAYTVILSNESHTFSELTTGQIITTDVYIMAFKGKTQIPSKITKIGDTEVSGTTTDTVSLYEKGIVAKGFNNDGSSTSNYVTVAANYNLKEENGTVPLTIVAGEQTFKKDFSFSVVKNGADGGTLQVKYKSSSTKPTISNNNVNDWDDTVPTPSAGQRVYMTQKLSTETNWSTPIQISGEDGATPTFSISENGYWIINGEETDAKAQGEKGETPTITVGENGNWLVDGEDTGTKAQGEQGKDGANIEYIYYRKIASGTPTTPTASTTIHTPTSTTYDKWTSSPCGITETYKYEYVSVRTKAAGAANWGNFSTPVIWSKWGEKGTDGDGIEYKYYLLNSADKPDYSADDANWTDEPKGVSASNMYEYVVQITHHGDGTTTNSAVALWAKWGETGSSATAYSMILSANVIAKSSTGSYTPSSITLSGKAKTGTNSPVAYSCYFKVETTTDMSNWVEDYKSTGNVSSCTYSVPSGIKALRCSMYLAGGTSTLLDQQVIPVVSDGTNGSDAYTVILSNESHTFSELTTGQIITTDVYIMAFKGKTQIPSKITKIGDTEVSGTTTDTVSLYEKGIVAKGFNNDGSSTSNYVTIVANYNLKEENGTVPLTIVAGEQTFKKDFSFSVVKNGVGISTVTNYYLATSAASGVTTSTTGWDTDPKTQTLTSTNKYLWNYEKITYTDGGTKDTAPCIIGNFAEEGKEGVSISSVTEYYARSTSSTSAPGDSSFSTSVPILDATYKYLWNYEKIEYTGGKTATYTPKCVIGVFGKDGEPGKGIKSTVITYQGHTSGTTAPTGTWLSYIPSVSADSYLWTRTVITYTDDTSSTSYSVAKMGTIGPSGKGIKSTSVTYQAHSSGTSTPTGTWLSYIPTLSEGQYLWTKTVITYTDDTTSTSYCVGMKGATGNGIKSTSITYQSSNSGTTTPTGTWLSYIPTVSQGDYLWTKTVITYTDNSTATSYSVGRMGMDGTPGKDGQNLYAESSASTTAQIKNATLKTGNPTSFATGSTITVKFTNANTNAVPWLRIYESTGTNYISVNKVDGTTAQYGQIKWNNVTPTSSNPFYWAAGTVMTFVFDGTYWVVVDVGATKMDLTSDGLVVGNYSSSGTLGNNVLIGASDINIRNNTTTYASFGANNIYLGKNSKSSVIDLCNGMGQIKSATNNYTSKQVLRMESTDGVTLFCDVPEYSGYTSSSNAYLNVAAVDKFSGSNTTTPIYEIPLINMSAAYTNGGKSYASSITMYPESLHLSGYLTTLSSTAEDLTVSAATKLALSAGSSYATLYGTDVYLKSTTASSSDFRPYYRKQDSISDDFYVDGFSASSGKTVYFIIPLSRPVIGSPTITVTGQITTRRVNGTESGYVTPTLTGELIDDGNGIRVKAVCGTAVNGVYEPCGLVADLTITFS